MTAHFRSDVAIAARNPPINDQTTRHCDSALAVKHMSQKAALCLHRQLLTACPGPRAEPATRRHAGSTLEDVAAQEGMGAPYAARLMRLNYLAPNIVVMILNGRQPVGLTARFVRGSC